MFIQELLCLKSAFFPPFNAAFKIQIVGGKKQIGAAFLGWKVKTLYE